jgi:uncharacterized protein YndB with AHSA1/START domain
VTTTTASIAYDAFFPHPIERVWRALTDPEVIVQWLMPTTFQPELGREFTFQAAPMPAIGFDGIVHCRVTVLDPPRRLAYTWAGGPLSTVVSYELEPASEGGVSGTRLRLEHSGFDLSRQFDSVAYGGMAGGWRHIVGPGLETVLQRIQAEAGV